MEKVASEVPEQEINKPKEVFNMIYASRFTAEEKAALKQLQADFSWNDDQLNFLIACMAFESNLNPQAKNRTSGAVGLIQFMPSICKAYGTTADEMLKRSFVEQLPYVKKHFLPYYKRTKTLSDMYMAILMPKYIGFADDYVIFHEGAKYDQNKGLDQNKDHYITKAEACRYVFNRYAEGLKDVD